MNFREYSDNTGVTIRVDAAEPGVLRGVRILGLASSNNRTYTPEAVKAAIGMYEGAKVNVDHPDNGDNNPRSYGDRIGVMKNVSYRDGEGLYGDFHYNPKHALAEQLAWDAQNAPQNVGMSHNVEGKAVRKEGKLVVEAITKVHSVDLVADPATTKGLYEQREGDLSDEPIGNVWASRARVQAATRRLAEHAGAGGSPSIWAGRRR